MPRSTRRCGCWALAGDSVRIPADDAGPDGSRRARKGAGRQRRTDDRVCAGRQRGHRRVRRLRRRSPTSCAEHGAWLHVDGAFGLWAAAAPATRHLTAGVERANSWAVDAHKWLNVPYDGAMAIVADTDAHLASMSLAGPYLVADPGQRDSTNYVPESSRRARAVPVYAAIRSLGRAGVAEMVERNCAQAQRMAKQLNEYSRRRGAQRRRPQSGAGPAARRRRRHPRRRRRDPARRNVLAGRHHVER